MNNQEITNEKSLNDEIKKFHELICNSKHPEFCEYFIENDESFDRIGTSRNAYKTEYVKIKEENLKLQALPSLQGSTATALEVIEVAVELELFDIVFRNP